MNGKVVPANQQIGMFSVVLLLLVASFNVSCDEPARFRLGVALENGDPLLLADDGRLVYRSDGSGKDFRSTEQIQEHFDWPAANRDGQIQMVLRNGRTLSLVGSPDGTIQWLTYDLTKYLADGAKLEPIAELTRSIQMPKPIAGPVRLLKAAAVDIAIYLAISSSDQQRYLVRVPAGLLTAGDSELLAPLPASLGQISAMTVAAEGIVVLATRGAEGAQLSFFAGSQPSRLLANMPCDLQSIDSLAYRSADELLAVGVPTSSTDSTAIFRLDAGFDGAQPIAHPVLLGQPPTVRSVFCNQRDCFALTSDPQQAVLKLTEESE